MFTSNICMGGIVTYFLSPLYHPFVLYFHSTTLPPCCPPFLLTWSPFCHPFSPYFPLLLPFSHFYFCLFAPLWSYLSPCSVALCHIFFNPFITSLPQFTLLHLYAPLLIIPCHILLLPLSQFFHPFAPWSCFCLSFFTSFRLFSTLPPPFNLFHLFPPHAHVYTTLLFQCFSLLLVMRGSSLLPTVLLHTSTLQPPAPLRLYHQSATVINTLQLHPRLNNSHGCVRCPFIRNLAKHPHISTCSLVHFSLIL